MKQLKFLTRFLMVAWLSCLASLAQAEEPQLGREYTLVAQPQPTDAKKIEVMEIFAYSCPHCFDLEPTIHPWSKKLPKDVSFARIHAVSNPAWLPLAKLFYALESLGELERLHADAFNAYHIKDVKLSDEKAAAEWVSKQGVDAKKFTDAYNSFGVQSKIARSRQLTSAFGINGVPTIVVAGKFQTSAAMAGGHENALRVTDYLINLARKAQQK
jgi:thiol:disulfide interchange protein DsbA